jgi:diguanylate cyclase (GGDEF)-like protein
MTNKKIQTLFSISALSVFLIGFGWYNYSMYHEVRKLVYDKVDKRLQTAARSTVMILPVDFHTQVGEPESISPVEDEKNIGQLSQLANISGVEYVYTMILKNGKIYFTASSATDEERRSGKLLTHYFDNYDDSDGEVERVFLEKKTLYSESTDAWGTHRSVAIPYESSEGQLYIAGADMKLDLFQEMLKEVTVKNIFLGLILLFSGLPMLMWSFKKSKLELMSLVEHDPLTKLFNRRGLSERLPKAIASCRRRKNYGTVLFIDLDHFKDINDSKGHDTGDIVLIEVAQRLKESVGTEDTLARFGGDEFVILIEDIGDNEEDAIGNTTKIANKILSVLSIPFYISEYKFKISGSIGIALFSKDAKADDLLRYADAAMYTAKDAGRNTMRFFDLDIQRISEEKIALTTRLQKAFEEDQNALFCHYQIQVDEKQKIIGVESLIRWNDPVLGSVSPSIFMPIAEKNDLIFKLGSFVLNQAGQLLKEWEQDPLKKSWRISVNISAIQLEEEYFVELIQGIIDEFNFEPAKMRLELTEGVLIKNTQKALLKIQELTVMGLTFSLDDFGTGYSSLSYFKQLPLHELKIDKSFVQDIMSDINDRNIVQTIIAFGNQLDLDVIAEGVETKEQYEMLLSLGCKYFQGYYFGKPTNYRSL